MNSYILSRQWFDFAFENGSRVKPIHGSLYFWIIELSNRLGWPAEFGNPTSQCMLACGISSYNTYKKAFDELVDFGFIEVKRKSTNQHNSCVIALSIIDKSLYKALDKALSDHSTKQCSITVQSTDSINKPLNNKPKTSKPTGSAEPKRVNTFDDMFEACRVIYPGTKRGFSTEFDDLTKKHKAEFSPDFFRAIYKGISLKVKTNKELERAGQFVPEWPHLKTYLNQRRWEEQTEVRAAPEPTKEPTAFNSLEEKDNYWGGRNPNFKPQTEAA